MTLLSHAPPFIEGFVLERLVRMICESPAVIALGHLAQGAIHIRLILMYRRMSGRFLKNT
jgi:hypothetical protein